jgi:hypothetical protein
VKDRKWSKKSTVCLHGLGKVNGRAIEVSRCES